VTVGVSDPEELRESSDEQIATLASKALWEISWGKPQVFDPKAEALEEQKNRNSFDPRQYTEEVAKIEAALRLMVDGSAARRARGYSARRSAKFFAPTWKRTGLHAGLPQGSFDAALADG
jgi:hypothetical protein